MSNSIQQLLTPEENYYLEKYIISNKPWFNNLISFLNNLYITYYNRLQILRIYEKILKKREEIGRLSRERDGPNKERKIGTKLFYLQLYTRKLDLINHTFGYLLKNVNNKLSNTTLTMKEVIKKIKENEDDYYEGERRLLREGRYMELRRMKLLKWIYNTELSLIELIVVQNMRIQRNYETNLNRFIENRGRETTREEYMSNRRKIENIKFNNYNLFTFVKKGHLKTDKCHNLFTPPSNSTYQREFMEHIERQYQNNRNMINFDVSYQKMGFEQLSFLSTLQEDEREKIKIAIKNLLNLYLVPIQSENIKLIMLSRDLILMCSSYILYKDDFNIDRINGQSIGKGVFGNVQPKNENTIVRYENLRITNKSQFSERPKIYASYQEQSYVSSMNLLAFFIQKYLFSLNKSYVPDIIDLRFDFDSRRDPYSPLSLNSMSKMISETTMNYTIINRLNNKRFKYTENLNQILCTSYEKSNYIPFILGILNKICDILIFYQHKCYFVHRDLHVENIMVSYNMNEELNEIDLSDFRVKLIDFSFSSIVIKNEEGQISQLNYINYKPHRTPFIANPYINMDWNKIDLKYFMVVSLLHFFKKIPIYPITTEFMNLFFRLFNIPMDYINRYEEFKRRNEIEKLYCFQGVYTPFNVVFENEIFLRIFGNERGEFDFNIFNPRILKQIIERFS